jgi:hypothetical protein
MCVRHVWPKLVLNPETSKKKINDCLSGPNVNGAGSQVHTRYMSYPLHVNDRESQNYQESAWLRRDLWVRGVSELAIARPGAAEIHGGANRTPKRET